MNHLQRIAVKAMVGLGLLHRQSFMIGGQWVWPSDSQSAYIDHGYKDIPNVYSIISLITQKSSIVPFEVYTVKSKAKAMKYKAMMMSAKTPKDIARAMSLKASAFDKVEGTAVQELLMNPNPNQTPQEFFEQLDGYKLLTGNSYIWAWTPGVGNNANKPVELHIPPSPMISIVTSEDGFGASSYKATFLSDAIPKEDIAHLKTWNPLTANDSLNEGVYGISPLTSCLRLLGKYRDADIAQGAMFHNMGPSGMLSGDSSGMTEDQATAIRDRYKQLYGRGSAKAGDIIVTSANVKWQKIGYSPVDMNIIEAKEEMLGELCNVYHVPIGLFTRVNSTENNMKESRKMMITDAVIPLVEARKEAINRWLVPKLGEDVFVEFDYSIFSEVTEELKDLVDAATKMYWITPNEKRELTNYDRDPDPMMDKVYLPSGLVPIDQIAGIPEDLPEEFAE